MAQSSRVMFCCLFLSILVFSCVVDAYYLPLEQSKFAAVKRSAMQSREKRYTDYQERASAFCTGMCMYEQRQSYSDCFDLCNWYAFRVRPKSPIARKIAIMRARKHQTPAVHTTPSSTRETDLQNNYQQLLRIGIPANHVAKPTAATKLKNKNGRRKQKQSRRLRVKAKPKTAARKLERTKNVKQNAKDEDCSCSNEETHTSIF